MELTNGFWGDQGRLGGVTSGPWVGRLLFVYPDTGAEWWTFVLDPPAVDGVPGDMYFRGNDEVGSLLEQWRVEWLPRDADEVELERVRFGWRPLRGGVDWLQD